MPPGDKPSAIAQPDTSRTPSRPAHRVEYRHLSFPSSKTASPADSIQCIVMSDSPPPSMLSATSLSVILEQARDSLIKTVETRVAPLFWRLAWRPEIEFIKPSSFDKQQNYRSRENQSWSVPKSRSTLSIKLRATVSSVNKENACLLTTLVTFIYLPNDGQIDDEGSQVRMTTIITKTSQLETVLDEESSALPPAQRLSAAHFREIDAGTDDGIRRATSAQTSVLSTPEPVDNRISDLAHLTPSTASPRRHSPSTEESSPSSLTHSPYKSDKKHSLYLTVQANIQQKLNDIIESSLFPRYKQKHSGTNVSAQSTDKIDKKRQNSASSQPEPKRRRSSSYSLVQSRNHSPILPFESTPSGEMRKTVIVTGTPDPPHNIHQETMGSAESQIYDDAGTVTDVNEGLASSTQRFKSAWESIIAKYSDEQYAESGDIVDLVTGDVIEDNGHLRSLPVDRSSLWTFFEEEDSRSDDVSEDDDDSRQRRSVEKDSNDRMFIPIVSENLDVDEYVFSDGGESFDPGVQEIGNVEKTVEPPLVLISDDEDDISDPENSSSPAQEIPRETSVRQIDKGSRESSPLEEISSAEFERLVGSGGVAFSAGSVPSHIKMIQSPKFKALCAERRRLKSQAHYNSDYNSPSLLSVRHIPDPFIKILKMLSLEAKTSDAERLQQKLGTLNIGTSQAHDPFLDSCSKFATGSFKRADDMAREIYDINQGPENSMWLPQEQHL